MARALHKVQKQISKKRGGKPTALHENSRDARRLRQAGAREDKLVRIMNAAHRTQQHYVNRVAWFQDAVSNYETPLTDEDMQKIVSEFIARDNEELAELKAEQRPGRPKSKAEEQIQERIDTESKEYKSGLWMPEMRDEASIKQLQQWAGRWGGLNTLQYVRTMMGPPGEIKTSSFPPKGLS